MIHRKRDIVIPTITATISITLEDLPTHYGLDLPLTLAEDGFSESSVRSLLENLRLHDISLTDELLPLLGSHVQSTEGAL
jgi:hypothetical protein